MAYSTPPTKAVGDTWTAAESNQYLRDNLEAGVPAIFAAKADIAIATGAAAAKALTIGNDWNVLEAQSGVSDGIRWAQTSPGAQLYRNTALSIADSTDTQVTGFSSTVWDNGTYVSGDTFVIPANNAGNYLVEVYAYFTGHATSARTRQIGIDKDGVTRWATFVQDGQTQDIHVHMTWMTYCAVGAVFKMRAYQKAGASVNLNSMYFTITKLR